MNVNTDEEISARDVIRSLISIATCGILGYVASIFFGWSTWLCIVVGLVVGWAAPGFIQGAKEELREALKENDESPE